jgi:hypothetical protein
MSYVASELQKPQPIVNDRPVVLAECVSQRANHVAQQDQERHRHQEVLSTNITISNKIE